MKKYLGIVLAAMFLFGFAASAFAIHAEIPSETQAVVAKGTTQITLGGELRVRGEIRKNTRDFNNTTNGTNDDGYYDQRVRLSLQADVTKNTTGFIHLESNNNSETGDNVTWGSGPTGTNANGATGIYSRGNSKKGDLRILEAWILHKGSGLLGVPAGVKVGHMPLALGNGLFFDHRKLGDDAIVLFVDPTKELHIGLLTAKFDEGTTTSANDSDAYVGLFVYKPSKNTSISADVTYVNDQGNLVGGGTDIHFWNFGLRADTNISGLGIKADVEIQSGKVTDLGAGVSDINFRGWAALLGLSYKLDPVTLSLAYATGSGDDNGNDNKINTFVTSLGTDPHYTYVYEYRSQTAGTQNVSAGLANTTYYKLGADAKLAKDLTGNLGLYILRATKKAYGTPELGGTTNVTSKNIGTELDAKITYQIDKNLRYWVEGGYLWAGKYWHVVTGAAKDPDNAYAVRHGIQLNF